jgi:nitrite reductase/ring-hydroxylating ferredoxin subunit
MGNMPFIKVGKVSEVPQDSVIEVSVGENVYAVCNVEGKLHALGGLCLHQGGPLGQGNVGNGRVVCPWHAWEWDCRTGENPDDPSQRVATYEVKVEGDEILLQVP